MKKVPWLSKLGSARKQQATKKQKTTQRRGGAQRGKKHNTDAPTEESAKTMYLGPILAMCFGGMLLGDVGFGTQCGDELVHRKSIDDVGFLEPATPGHGYAMPYEWEVEDIVSVCGDHHFHASSFAHAEVDVGEVEAIGIRVALHRDAVFRGSGEDLFHVVIEGIAAEK